MFLFYTITININVVQLTARYCGPRPRHRSKKPVNGRFLRQNNGQKFGKKFRCLEFYETSKKRIKNFNFPPSIISIKIPSSGLSRQSAASLDRNCRRLVPLVQSGNKITLPGDPARPKFMFMLILSSDSLFLLIGSNLSLKME